MDMSPSLPSATIRAVIDLTASASLDVSPARVYAEVADLSTYPDWLGIVLDAEVDGAAADAWYVDLGARIGPVKAAKRVRMVRTVADEPTHARFERAELDDRRVGDAPAGREHSAWILDAAVSPRSVLTMKLHYGGALFFPGLDKILAVEVDKAGDRLRDRLHRPSSS
jgi:polyketide cyclase/dehydrase/lipid transport protein